MIADEESVAGATFSRNRILMVNFLSGYLTFGSGSTSFVEVANTGFARQPITFGPIMGGRTSNTGNVSFSATANIPAVTQFGIYDASDVLILWWNQAGPQSLAAGQCYMVQCGAIELEIPSMVTPPHYSVSLLTPANVNIGHVLAQTIGGQVQFDLKTGTSVQINGGQIGEM